MVVEVRIISCFVVLVALATKGSSLPEPEYPAAVVEFDANKGSRIVGGTEATPGEFPWIVQVIVTRNGNTNYGFMCGGSLISPDWVMTAAHCIDRVDSVTVTLGAHNTDLNEPGRVVLQSKEWHIHPDYDSSKFPDDIGLIKLPSSVALTNRIRPITLADYSNSKHVNDTVVVTGWGIFSDAIGLTSNVLRKATTNVIANEVCQETWEGIVTNGTICTSGADGKGTCLGDSGGPMIYMQKDGSWIQIGITSFGRERCELGYPNGFTRVNFYNRWIESITGMSIATTQRPTTTKSTAFTCQGKADGNHANPNDCASFYMCSNGTAYLFNCPATLVFNPNLKQCDYRASVPQCNV